MSRRYRLRPWQIRALIPEDVMGVYILWSPTSPVYVGRSDTSLRRRLLEHARVWPDVFFTYDVAYSSRHADAIEVSLVHTLGDRATHIDHLQRSTAGEPELATSPSTPSTTSVGPG